MFPQIGYLVFTFHQTSSFVICRQCAQMFSVALGAEATVEIHQCKQLGNATAHQVPRGREGGVWLGGQEAKKEPGERLKQS